MVLVVIKGLSCEIHVGDRRVGDEVRAFKRDTKVVLHIVYLNGSLELVLIIEDRVARRHVRVHADQAH